MPKGFGVWAMTVRWAIAARAYWLGDVGVQVAALVADLELRQDACGT